MSLSQSDEPSKLMKQLEGLMGSEALGVWYQSGIQFQKAPYLDNGGNVV